MFFSLSSLIKRVYKKKQPSKEDCRGRNKKTRPERTTGAPEVKILVNSELILIVFHNTLGKGKSKRGEGSFKRGFVNQQQIANSTLGDRGTVHGLTKHRERKGEDRKRESDAQLHILITGQIIPK